MSETEGAIWASKHFVFWLLCGTTIAVGTHPLFRFILRAGSNQRKRWHAHPHPIRRLLNYYGHGLVEMRLLYLLRRLTERIHRHDYSNSCELADLTRKAVYWFNKSSVKTHHHYHEFFVFVGAEAIAVVDWEPFLVHARRQRLCDFHRAKNFKKSGPPRLPAEWVH